MDIGTIITVIGGVRSGKTSWSEKLAAQIAANDNSRLVYLASGIAFDKEMTARIDRHKEDRVLHQWVTIEQPVDLMSCTSKLQPGDVVVWDCVTTWLTNELLRKLDGKESSELQGAVEREISNDLRSFIKWAQSNLHTCFVVSNEVLSEEVFEDGLTASYQRMIGELHQSLVARSQIAIEMEVGIPLIRKGAYPV